MEKPIIEPKPHVVLLSSPGLGHLIPILELGKQLVTLFNFKVTIFASISHSSPAESRLLRSSTTPNLCSIIQLPNVDVSGLVEPSAAVVTRLAVMMREIKQAFRSALLNVQPKPSVLIVDLFGTESLSIADELGIPKYVYFGCSAWFVALTVYTPILDKEVHGQYIDQTEPLKIPGCMPVRPEDVHDPLLDRTNQQYYEFLRIGLEIPTADGLLLNTWEDLQRKTLSALREMVKIPVFPIGPLTRPVEPDGLRGELLEWLEKQPKESVILVSFGSGGTLSHEQMTEVAWGLELSQQRFIWVVRKPTVKTGDGSYFTSGKNGDDTWTYLPDGFPMRIRNRGLLVAEWAPQVDILSHPSVGGFLSHSGWNSTLESITNGVPMIVWPLYAEQRLNATLLSEELGVAVRSKTLPSRGVIGREEIAVMMRKVIVDEEGINIRNKVKELKSSGEKALSKDGSSYNALTVLAGGWQVEKTP